MGVVKKLYPEKAMIKVEFSEWGVGFISYEDSECFDFFLNVHPESDRMMRAKDSKDDSSACAM